MADIVFVIIGAIVTGVIIGGLARLALPGRQSISLLLTIVLGIVGARVGGFVASLLTLGGGTGGFSLATILVQVVVAAVGVAIVGGRTKA